MYRPVFSTTSFPFGFYEIKLVRFHTVTEGSENPSVDFLPGKDFERPLFEIAPPFALPKSRENVETVVGMLEGSIERVFLAPRYANGLPGRNAKQFAVFVFVRKPHIGRRYRLDRFKLVPSPVGVSNDNETAAVNAFLQQRTLTKLSVINASYEQTQSQLDNPVCVAYFPTIIANSKEEAQAYCASLADTTILGGQSVSTPLKPQLEPLGNPLRS